MTRKPQTGKRAPKRRISKRQIVFYILSVIIIMSMALGYVITFATPQEQNAPTPTPISLIIASPSTSSVA